MFVTPFRISFINEERLGWIICDLIVDLFFLVDIALNFFSAIYDEDDNLLIERKDIARKYLTSWFGIDLISTIPFSFILLSTTSNSLSKFIRLPKLCRLIKLTKFNIF